MAPTKSDLSFDDLLRAGLGVPLKESESAAEELDADEQAGRVAEAPPSPAPTSTKSPGKSEENTSRQ